MSRQGDCWDNAVAESFFATLKVELVHDAIWATEEGARRALRVPELFYNGQRRHSALGYLSPRASSDDCSRSIGTQPRCLQTGAVQCQGCLHSGSVGFRYGRCD